MTNIYNTHHVYATSSLSPFKKKTDTNEEKGTLIYGCSMLIENRKKSWKGDIISTMEFTEKETILLLGH